VASAASSKASARASFSMSLESRISTVSPPR
jgi:hypothetical protein